MSRHGMEEGAIDSIERFEELLRELQTLMVGHTPEKTIAGPRIWIPPSFATRGPMSAHTLFIRASLFRGIDIFVYVNRSVNPHSFRHRREVTTPERPLATPITFPIEFAPSLR